MTRHEFDELFAMAREDETLFQNHIIEEHGLIASPASAEEIANAEQRLGVRLPVDYVHFLQTYGGGVIGHVEIATAEADGNRNLFWEQPLIGSDRNFIAISGNGSGDYYGFEVKDGVCESKPVFWDHELGGEIAPTKFNDLFEFIAMHGFMDLFERQENGLL